ncbi:hypothetical protein [Actinoplanes philippinensis]|uniref:hypothetical protein n=1 Tax=Actinoplanes philippinensis TaxID=35752 RepID=UPI0033C05819
MTFTVADSAVPHRLPTPDPGTPYRLSDLIQRHRAGDAVFLTDAVLSHRGPHDPLLYTAHRNVLPPRTVRGRGWFADLVQYQPGRLPGGELVRSTGHWNTPGQLEVFQVLSGRVLMLSAWTSSTSATLTHQVCSPGQLAVIPFGGWHLTLVLDGPADVFNVYTELDDAAAPVPADERGKYRRAAAVELTAVGHRDGFTITGPAAGAARWGTAQQVWEPGWLRDITGEAGDLPAFIRGADDATLDMLTRQARRLVPTCHRTDLR